MSLLIRIILIGTVIYLIFKSFADYARTPEEEHRTEPRKPENKIKKISKEVGEYVDYEEVD